MIILDFYGMPGSGKSTISHHLAERLSARNYVVIEPTWQINMSSPLFRILVKVNRSIVFSVKNPGFMRNILLLMDKNAHNSLQEKLKLFMNLGFILSILKKEKNVDFLICDQGIAQAVVSLYTESSLENAARCYKLMQSCLGAQIQPIHIESEIHTVLKRLENRKDGRSRAEKLKGGQRKNMLEKINQLCRLFAKEDHAIVVSNDSRLEDFDFDCLISTIECRVGNHDQIHPQT